jgi:alkylation response protein AidB-like acyl-CoA dehydrogenase
MERAELQDAVRKALGADGLVPDAAKSWAAISELGALMMTVPEELGGLGLGREAEAVIYTELGRALVPGAAIAQMLVIAALSKAEELPGRDDLLARAMGGEMMTTSLALHDPLTAVPDADRATHILIVRPDRVALHATTRSASQRTTWDETRRLFDVALDEAGGLTLAQGAAAATLSDQLQSQLLLALAADSLGGSAALLTLTIDYLKTRRQFDRPLALFQALKHRVADLKIALELADALLWARATGAASLVELGALKAWATTTYVAVAEEAIQLHGGIGLTSEYYCHLFLKRALLNAALGGDADAHDARTGRDLLESLT